MKRRCEPVTLAPLSRVWGASSQDPPTADGLHASASADSTLSANLSAADARQPTSYSKWLNAFMDSAATSCEAENAAASMTAIVV